MENYLDEILKISKPYLLKSFSRERHEEFLSAISKLNQIQNRDEIIKSFSDIYLAR